MSSLSILAYRQLQLRMALILATLFVLGAFLPPATVQAGSGYAYYWSLTFNFEENANGSLYVAVGHEQNGGVQEPPIYAQTYKVPCTRVGNAGISGGVLKLDGGYFSCDLDLQHALEDAFAACNAIVAGCHKDIQDVESYANFRGMAQVLSANPGPAPIFYHKDASYEINPQSSQSQITAFLAPHGVIPSTPAIVAPALNAWQTYTARYACDPSCEMYYGVTGALEVVVTPDLKVPFSTPSTTVYLGFDPITGLAAPAGTMVDKIFVDPPNYGND